MIEQYSTLTSCPHLRRNITSALAVLGEHDHFTNYMGLNYSARGIESIKFYFLTTAKIGIKEISRFFPHADAIQDEYRKHEGSRTFDLDNLGVTFSIKADRSGLISHAYYQQRVGEKAYFPATIELPVMEKSIRDDFYVREFKGGEATEKNYFLMSNRDNIRYTMDYFQVSEVPESEVTHIEYAEFPGAQKMVMVIPDRTARIRYLERTGNENEMSLVRHLMARYGWFPEFPGKYLSGRTRTVYFFQESAASGFFAKARTLEQAFL